VLARTIILGLIVLAFRPVDAATFLVNDAADLTDSLPGNGVCETSSGNQVCTLRAAIQETNALPGRDTILLPAGTYVLALSGSPEDAAASGDLDVTGDLDIIGAGEASAMVDGAALDRVLHIDPFLSGIDVGMRNLTITNGRAPDLFDIQLGAGGAIHNRGTLRLIDVTVRDSQTTGITPGGGIHNRGTLTLTRVKITGNRGYSGGGISSEGSLDISDSTISDNSTYGATGSGGGINNSGLMTLRDTLLSANSSNVGGGLRNGGSQTSRLVNVTLSDNTATFTLGGGVSNQGILDMINSTVSGNRAQTSGGGIENNNLLALRNATLVNNSATTGQGGGIYNRSAFDIENTLLAGNFAAGAENNCHLTAGGVTSYGHNLETRNTCGLNGPADLVNTPAEIDSLRDNGGNGPTHALLDTSAAIDAGNPDGCKDTHIVDLATDQTGQFRSIDGDADGLRRCDIGAYEFDRYEIRGLLAHATPVFLRWNALAVASGYQVYRGNIQGLPSGDWGACLGADLTVTEFSDVLVPPTGQVFFYVVTARVNGQEWTLGFDHLGNERRRLTGSSCP
jgi:hypothetical protein